MRLKELEIQGFKSFPDKTKITIGEGITGVVGPNGSGKSNISDSIRWVLGETSSKQLRGSGKMEDVIFGGTQSRGAMGFASVALTIDNSDHGLDMDADELRSSYIQVMNRFCKVTKAQVAELTGVLSDIYPIPLIVYYEEYIKILQPKVLKYIELR